MVEIGNKELHGQARHHDRQGAQGYRDAQAGRRCLPVALAERLGHAPEHLKEVLAEEGNHGDDAAELDHGRDRHPGIAPAQHHGHHLEMGRAADRQKFGEPLNDAQHQVVPASLKQPQGWGGFQRGHGGCGGNNGADPMAARGRWPAIEGGRVP